MLHILSFFLLKPSRAIFFKKNLFLQTMCDNYYEEFIDDLDIELLTNEFPDEMLGITIPETRYSDELKSKLRPILKLSEKKFNKGKKIVGELKKDYADVPFLAFLELHFEQDKAEDVFAKKLSYFQEQFPDYPLIKLASLIHSFLKNLDQTNVSEIVPLHDIFPGRESIHDFEMQQYLVYAVFVALLGENKSRLAAFHEVLVDLEFPNDFMELVYSLIMTEKIRVAAQLAGEIE